MPYQLKVPVTFLALEDGVSFAKIIGER